MKVSNAMVALYMLSAGSFEDFLPGTAQAPRERRFDSCSHRIARGTPEATSTSTS